MKHLSEEKARLGIRVHAVAFVVTMLLLVAINTWTGPPYWVVWVLAAWTVGLLSHWYFAPGRGVRRT